MKALRTVSGLGKVFEAMLGGMMTNGRLISDDLIFERVILSEHVARLAMGVPGRVFGCW